MLLAAYGGLRFGELIGLRRRDIDLLHGQIIVESQLVELGSGRHLRTEPKSAAGRRRVALSPFVTKELETHLERYVAGGPDALLFVGDRGGSPTRTNWARIWARARKEAGLPDNVHLHDLRHAGATLSAQLGATTKELMARLGHASPRAALIYQHAADGRHRVLADRLEELAADATRSDSPRHRSREVPAMHARWRAIRCQRCCTPMRTTTAPSRDFVKWRRWDSNPRPPACKAGALPAELRPQMSRC